MALLAEAFKLRPDHVDLSCFMALFRTSKQLRTQCEMLFSQHDILRRCLLVAVREVIEGNTARWRDIQALMYLCRGAWGLLPMASLLDLQGALLASRGVRSLSLLFVQAGARITEDVLITAALSNNPGLKEVVQSCNDLGIRADLPPALVRYCHGLLRPRHLQHLTADTLFSIAAVACASPDQEGVANDTSTFLQHQAAQAFTSLQVKQLLQQLLLQCKAGASQYPRGECMEMLVHLPAAAMLDVPTKHKLLEECAGCCRKLYLLPLLRKPQLYMDLWVDLCSAAIKNKSYRTCLSELLKQSTASQAPLAAWEQLLELAIEEQQASRLSRLLRHPALAAFPSEVAVKLAERAVKQPQHDCISTLIKHPAVAALPPAAAAELVEIAIKQQQPECLSCLMQHPAVAAIPCEVAAGLMRLAQQQQGADMLGCLLEKDALPAPLDVLEELLNLCSHGNGPKGCGLCAVLRRVVKTDWFEYLPETLQLLEVAACSKTSSSHDGFAIVLGQLWGLDREGFLTVAKGVLNVPVVGQANKEAFNYFIVEGLDCLRADAEDSDDEVLGDIVESKQVPEGQELTAEHLGELFVAALEHESTLGMELLAEQEELLEVLDDWGVVEKLIMKCDEMGTAAAAGLKEVLLSETPGGRQLQRWWKKPVAPLFESYEPGNDHESDGWWSLWQTGSEKTEGPWPSFGGSESSWEGISRVNCEAE